MALNKKPGKLDAVGITVAVSEAAVGIADAVATAEDAIADAAEDANAVIVAIDGIVEDRADAGMLADAEDAIAGAAYGAIAEVVATAGAMVAVVKEAAVAPVANAEVRACNVRETRAPAGPTSSPGHFRAACP